MSVSEHSAAAGIPIPTDTRFESRLLYLLALGFAAVVLVWGVLAQLDSAAVAAGEVIPVGRVRTVQHLEGGIIRAIAVTEGEEVKSGQVLVSLDDTEARAQLALAQTERSAQEALVARLEAERDGRPFQPVPDSLSSPSVLAQLRLFETRQATLHKELDGLQERLAGLRQELAGWQQKGHALAAMRAHADEESRLNQRLYERNFISRPRLLQLQSQRDDTAARVSENDAEAAQVRQRIADTEVAMSKLKDDWMSDLLEQLRRAQDAAAEATQRVAVAQDRLARTQIRAPQDGIVNNLRSTTIGGVITPGGAVADIVPVDESLQIEARVQPDDIDVVAEGRPARVRLTAYKARSHFTLRGKVVQVSASTFHDGQPEGRPYYKARIEIGADELRKVERARLIPGMLAQVEIEAGRRSALRYLAEPLLESMHRAFKES